MNQRDTNMTDKKRGSAGNGDPELTPAMFHILLALADGPRHGYAIMQQVEAATRSEIRLPPGTLYRSIKRLLGDGLIEEADAPPDDGPQSERRRYYAISARGRELAGAQARRMAEIVGLAREKNLLEGPKRA
jgi:DNA-binding PadR family transcriptional regulator